MSSHYGEIILGAMLTAVFIQLWRRFDAIDKRLDAITDLPIVQAAAWIKVASEVNRKEAAKCPDSK
jgi:hypothetical protein